MIEYINRFTQDPHNTLHLMPVTGKKKEIDAIGMFFNCKKENVESVLAGNVKRDFNEASFS